MSLYVDEDNGDGAVVTFKRTPLEFFDGERVRYMRGWGPLQRSPARRWASSHDMYEPRHWLDHLCRLKRSDGHIVFRAEPYSLGPEDLDDLNLLREDGWRVYIGGYPCHYPLAIPISIEKPERGT